MNLWIFSTVKTKKWNKEHKTFQLYCNTAFSAETPRLQKRARWCYMHPKQKQACLIRTEDQGMEGMGRGSWWNRLGTKCTSSQKIKGQIGSLSLALLDAVTQEYCVAFQDDLHGVSRYKDLEAWDVFIYVCVFVCVHLSSPLLSKCINISLEQRFSIPVLAPPRYAYFACLS